MLARNIEEGNARSKPKAKQIGIFRRYAVDLGMDSQELESVFPSLVKTDDEGIKSVKYSIFVPILIKAVQEQQEQIESLKSEIANLKEK